MENLPDPGSRSLVSSFVQDYDVATYSGNKAEIGDKSLALARLAREVIHEMNAGLISPQDATAAMDKLKQMQQVKMGNAVGTVRTIVKTFAHIFIPEAKRAELSSTTQLHEAAKTYNTLTTHSRLQARLPGNDATDFRALVGALESEIDSRFDKASMPDGQAVLIHITEDNGFGDVMLAIKSAKALRAQFPNLNVQFSVHAKTVLPNAVIERVNQSMGNDACPVFNWNARPEGLPHPALVIHAANHADLEVQNTWGDFDRPPAQVTLKEFGWGVSGGESGGLGKASLGIFVDETMGQQESATSGEGIHSLSRQDVAQTILKGLDPQTYTDQNKLYIGYSHLPESVPAFVNTMVAMNGNDATNKNLDFMVRSEHMIPGTKWKMETSETGISIKESGFGKPYVAGEIKFEDLAKNGVSSVQIVHVKRVVVEVTVEQPDGSSKIVRSLQPEKRGDGSFIFESEDPFEIPGASREGKTLRILDLFPVPPQDMLKLLSSSEPEVMVTGNQSVSEAISARKAFFYEALPNDKAFAQQMVAFANQGNSQMGNIMEGMQIAQGRRGVNDQKLGESLRDPAIRAQFRQFGSEVVENKNLAKCLGQRVKRGIIAHVDPSVGKAVGRLQEESAQLVSRLHQAHDQEYERNPVSNAGAPVTAPDEALSKLAGSVSQDLASLDKALQEL